MYVGIVFGCNENSSYKLQTIEIFRSDSGKQIRYAFSTGTLLEEIRPSIMFLHVSMLIRATSTVYNETIWTFKLIFHTAIVIYNKKYCTFKNDYPRDFPFVM